MPRLREYAGFIEFQRITTKRDGIWRKLVSRKRNGPIRAFVFLSNIRRALCVHIRYTYEQAQRAMEIINSVSLKIRDAVVVFAELYSPLEIQRKFSNDPLYPRSSLL